MSMALVSTYNRVSHWAELLEQMHCRPQTRCASQVSPHQSAVGWSIGICGAKHGDLCIKKAVALEVADILYSRWDVCVLVLNGSFFIFADQGE